MCLVPWQKSLTTATYRLDTRHIANVESAHYCNSEMLGHYVSPGWAAALFSQDSVELVTLLPIVHTVQDIGTFPSSQMQTQPNASIPLFPWRETRNKPPPAAFPFGRIGFLGTRRQQLILSSSCSRAGACRHLRMLVQMCCKSDGAFIVLMLSVHVLCALWTVGLLVLRHVL